MKKKEIEKLWSIESGSKNYRKRHKIWENRTVLQIKANMKVNINIDTNMKIPFS